MNKAILTIFILFCSVISSKAQNNYSPVVSFGDNGYKTIDVFPNSAELVNSTIKDANGNYYLGGPLTDSTSNFAITKVLSNGQLDLSFGLNGTFVFDVPNYGIENLRSLAIQNDGKIVFVGEAFKSNVGYDGIIGRITTNGQLDVSFDGDGYKLFNNTNRYDSFYSVAIQADGKILAAGYSAQVSTYDFRGLVIRYLSNGTIDNTFNGTGIYIDPQPSEIIKISLLPDNSIIFGGWIGTHSRICKMLPNGTFDTSFGINGKYLDSYPSVNFGVIDYEIATDNSITVLANSHYGSNSTVDTNYLYRLNNNGVFDGAFGTGGYTRFYVPNNYDVVSHDLLQLSDNRFIVAGYIMPVFGTVNDSRCFITEFSNSGVRNTGFGDFGYSIYDPNTYREEYVNVIEDNGSLVITGNIAEMPAPNYADMFITKLHFCTLNIVATNNNDTFSVPPGADSYRWLNCSTQAIVPNETGNTFVPSTNGNYAAIVTEGQCTDTSNCIAISSLCELTVIAVNSNNSLSVPAGSDTYQWINCITQTIIPNETGPVFTPTLSGAYAVIVTEGQCIDTSNCLEFCNFSVVAVNNNSSLSVPVGSDAYQWINCTTQAIIPNESGPVFNPAISGTYAAIVTEGQCTDTSDCLEFCNFHVVVINNNNSLSVPAGSDFYQWMDCSTQTIIPNETGNVFTPASSGIYAVIVIEGQCTDTSDCLDFCNFYVVAANSNNSLSVPAGSDTYQWISCSAQTIIPNETGNVFIPASNGIYAAIVTEGQCADTSDCITISTLSLYEANRIKPVISPNPFTSNFSISGLELNDMVFIYSTEGKLLDSKKVENVNFNYHSEKLSSGTYLLRIKHATNSFEESKLVIVKE